jgi:ABC-2 type transport system permease protein
LGFVKGWAPEAVISTVAGFSFLTHFNAIIRGVIDLRDSVFFLSAIAFFLYANTVIVDLKKAD